MTILGDVTGAAAGAAGSVGTGAASVTAPAAAPLPLTAPRSVEPVGPVAPVTRALTGTLAPVLSAPVETASQVIETPTPTPPGGAIAGLTGTLTTTADRLLTATTGALTTTAGNVVGTTTAALTNTTDQLLTTTGTGTGTAVGLLADTTSTLTSEAGTAVAGLSSAVDSIAGRLSATASDLIAGVGTAVGEIAGTTVTTLDRVPALLVPVTSVAAPTGPVMGIITGVLDGATHPISLLVSPAGALLLAAQATIVSSTAVAHGLLDATLAGTAAGVLPLAVAPAASASGAPAYGAGTQISAYGAASPTGALTAGPAPLWVQPTSNDLLAGTRAASALSVPARTGLNGPFPVLDAPISSAGRSGENPPVATACAGLPERLLGAATAEAPAGPGRGPLPSGPTGPTSPTGSSNLTGGSGPSASDLTGRVLLVDGSGWTRVGWRLGSFIPLLRYTTVERPG